MLGHPFLTASSPTICATTIASDGVKAGSNGGGAIMQLMAGEAIIPRQNAPINAAKAADRRGKLLNGRIDDRPVVKLSIHDHNTTVRSLFGRSLFYRV